MKYGNLRILLILLFVSLITIPIALCSPPTSPIVYVDTDGSGDYNCDGINDHIEINDAINYVAENSDFTTVHLTGPNTYWIDDSIYLKNNVILEGDSDAIVKLVDNAGWATTFRGLVDVYDGVGVDNVIIRGFKIDGNKANQPEDTGLGYYNCIKLRKSYNVAIYDMYLTNNLGDGVMVDHVTDTTTPVNIDVHDNVISETGHDGVYLKHISDVNVYNNIIKTQTNGGVRLTNTNNGKIYNNTIYSDKTGGVGIEVTRGGSGVVNNIEIFENTVYETAISGIRIKSEDSGVPISSATGVHIHHNLIYYTGSSWSTRTTAGININGFNNTIIENNVLDYNRKDSISYDEYYGSINSHTELVTIVRNNIITRSQSYSDATSISGYGVHNYYPANHVFVLENNCFYDNDNSDYKNAISTTDIYVNPLFADPTNQDYHLKSTAGRMSDSGWVLDSVTSPLIDAGHSKSDYSNEPESNGDRINIGLYGNTAEASKSSSDVSIPVTDDEGIPTTDSTSTQSLVYDNRLREGSPDTTFAESNYIDIGHADGVGSYRDVMKFDLSAYDTTDIVSSATLSLTWYYPAATTRNSDTIVEIYRAADWNPSQVSWSDSAYGTPWNNEGGDWFDKNNVAHGSTPYASVTFKANDIPDNKYHEFDVTELVQKYVSGEYSNTGFFIKARNENNNYIAFYSSEWSNPEQRPKLTIELMEQDSQRPIASVSSVQTVTSGETITLDGSESTDNVGIVSYLWDFDADDGIQQDATGASVQHTYDNSGIYTATLKVADISGNTDSETVTITVIDENPTPSADYTSTQTPVYDNRLREASADDTFGQDYYIDIGNKNNIGSYRDIIWFDLSGYSETDTITNADLKLFWYYPSDSTRDEDTIVDIYRADDWDPDYVSWSNSEAGTQWNNAGGDWFDRNNVAQGSTPYASITFKATDVPDNQYYEFDVTELVQEYVSGEYSNTGFFLKARDENSNYIAFYSSDIGNSDRMPKLTIDHSTGQDSASVPETPSNTAPVINPISARSVDETDTLTFVVSATDVNGDSLTYLATGLPAGASFNAASRIFSWTPSKGDSGIYTVTFTVTDGDLSDSTTTRITVNELNTAPEVEQNHAPSITLFEPSAGTVFEEGSTVNIKVTASDADGQSLSYAIMINGETVSTSADYSWVLDYSSAGTYTIKAVVSDGIDDVSAEHTITIKEQTTTNTDVPRWDVNEDGIVNVLDITLIGQNYGMTYTGDLPRWDVNQDGVVNILDLSIVSSHMGETTN